MKNEIHLFPYVLARIAGGPLTEFARTNLRQTITLLDQLKSIEKDLDQAKEDISNNLHSFIATVADKELRYTLIQFRRDLYNEKVSTSLPKEIEKILSDHVKIHISRYLSLEQKKQKLLALTEKSFLKEQKQNEKTFKELLKKPNFQNGITLSSDTLPKSLTKYLTEHIKPLPKVERSLTKYLSRMYTKPSPFSTFTSLAYRDISSKKKIRSKILDTKSHVQLNHYLFQYIYGLLVQNKKIRRHLPIQANITIRPDASQFVFLANNFNRESIQRITITPALQYIYSFMLEKQNWIYNDLVNELLAQQFTTVSTKEMEKYIDSLLKYGFIEYDFGISGIDTEWDIKLAHFLNPLTAQFPYLSELRDTLISLRKSIGLYEHATSETRRKILNVAFTIFRKTCLQLHTAAELPKKEHVSFSDSYISVKNKEKKQKKDELFTYKYDTAFTLKPQMMWYEDTSTTTSVDFSAHAKNSLEIFGNLLNRTGWFDGCTEKIDEFSDFFTNNYQINDHIDLLEFYEKYHRAKKEKKKNLHTKSIIASRKRNDQYLALFIKKIKSRLDNSDTFTIEQNDIEHIPQAQSPTSFGAFFYLMKDNNEISIVLNSTTPGFGRMYSRFLNLFPNEVMYTLRNWNEKVQKNAFLAEPTDASIFNANLHPSLMPFEITSPESYTNASIKQQVPITDIEIIYKKTDKRIHLLHKKTQKEILAFDLGFQGIRGRSELYEFLSSFTLGAHHNIYNLTNKINAILKKDNSKEQISILPRITYEKSIVLQRKRWEIPYKFFPKRMPQESDWEYFRKIDTWRKSLSLPDEIFVKLTSDKPQYIHFENHLLLSLFEKMIEKLKEKEILQIEEMLPTSEDTKKFQTNNSVTEFLVQWYF